MPNTRTTRRSSKNDDSPFATGLSDKELMNNMQGSGGARDPEMVMLGNGDEMHLAIVSPKAQWTTFSQHYIDNEYKICSGDGCDYCDEGGRPSRRAMIGVYVSRRYKPASKEYKAVRMKDEGHKYMILNSQVVETLMKISKRRGGVLDDRMYVFQRDGTGFDTKYHVERLDDKPTRVMKNWPKMDTHGKVMSMFKQQKEDSEDSSTSKSKSKSSKGSYDFDDEMDKFDDEKPKRRSSRRRSG